MSRVKSQISISVDGFVAGPNQSLENPIGEGGLRLHEWVFETAAWHAMQGEAGGEQGSDSDAVAGINANVGAYIMGRNMFTPGRGEWDLDWKGWWGDDPPYHVPVFVLTHHPRAPLPMQGGTTFNFVTEGVEHALGLARTAAGEKDVSIAGGANTIQQFLHADLIDELTLHVAPVLLGRGERLFENVGDPKFKPVGVNGSGRVTHIKYEIEHKN
ncbi:MAG TPA: dihydrofolate reductase family protein [Candidatus Dormibacteraeota bacterium]|nr:dihydrofolate reductase family protein [Candidatus Dormibacteraeota bacterium]